MEQTLTNLVNENREETGNNSAQSLTRRMAEHQQEMKLLLERLTTKDKLRHQIRELKKNEKTSARITLLQGLYKMLDQAGLSYEKGLSASDYFQLVRQAPEGIFKSEEEIIMETLQQTLQDFPDPAAYLARVVDALEDPADQWQNDTLRLRLLKQFYKYTDALQPAGVGGNAYIRRYIRNKNNKKLPETIDEQIQLIEDDIFDALEQATKDQCRPGERYGLLRICNDLVTGTFHTGGAPRRNLYYLALAYNVPLLLEGFRIRVHVERANGQETSHLILEKAEPSASPLVNLPADLSPVQNLRTESTVVPVSLEKNLFHEYYQNNILRFLADIEEGTVDNDPTGYGINYGNYADAVYLYLLVRDIPAVEKLELASKLISQVEVMINKKSQGAEQAVSDGQDQRVDTTVFREYYNPLSDTQVFAKDSDAFTDFLKDNYNCTRRRGCSSFDAHSENETARTFSEAMAMYLKECEGFRPYGIWFADPKSEEIDPEVATLYRLLKKMHEYLLKPLNDYLGPDAIQTRTRLMTLFYYFYNEVHSMQDVESEEDRAETLREKAGLKLDPNLEGVLSSSKNADMKSLADVIQDYQLYLNPILADSGFQLLDPKNFFDMALLYSSFVYIKKI